MGFRGVAALLFLKRIVRLASIGAIDVGRLVRRDTLSGARARQRFMAGWWDTKKKGVAAHAAVCDQVAFSVFQSGDFCCSGYSA
jgi:hypothetical protein